jgi:hypothetical protein
MVRDVHRKPLADLYMLVCWPYVRSKVSHLWQSGMLIAIWAKLHRSSWCAETLIFLQGSGDHALKADRSLIDPIIKLKADCPKIQEYLHVSQYDSLIDTSCINWQCLTFWRWSGGCSILSWGKTSDQIRNTSSLFWDLSFLLLDWRIPSTCVTKSGVPNSEREIG